MKSRHRLWVAATLLLAQQLALADVRMVSGATPIPGGNARAAGDLTVINDRLAFALAVASPVPYGVPRGAIIDIAPVTDSGIGRDRVVFADFIPNNWSAWPNTYQHVEILSKGPQEVRIRTERDFGKVNVTTTYTLRDRSDCIELSTTLNNAGDAALPGLLSGFTLWPSSGYLFAVPGLVGVKEGEARAALAHRVSAYDRDWSITLHAPYFDHVGSGSRDLFLLHTLKPKETRTFDGWLQVGARGNLAPVVTTEIDQTHLERGTIHGRVAARDGTPVTDAVVVVEKKAKPYAWVLAASGAYRTDLPTGEYAVYATGRNYSRSAPTRISVLAGSDSLQDFDGLENPGRVEFSIADEAKRAPLDARIVISEGEKPVVQFLGGTTFFTELARKGRATIPIAPGEYVFSISAGAGVLARDVQAKAKVRPNEATNISVAIARLFDPAARGWYSADLHHHADQAEAVTPPEDLVRSQLAAGLDFLFVSDHDSTINHAKLQELAALRGMRFIPGMEISPSWGHFNAYPLNPGAKLEIDTSTATIDAVLNEARREGATIVQVNHPFIPYGYFASVAAGVAPGGFNKAFDLIEINSTVPKDDPKVLAKLWDFWNAGERYYLSAGSDTHDVWNEQSGRVRAFVHLTQPPTVAGFAQALKDGHAYVTYGPLIFPSRMFGTSLKLRPGAALTLGFDFASVAGLRKVDLVSQGKIADSRTFADGPLTAHVDFVVRAAEPAWFALLVEDRAERKAYSNPIWIR